MRGSIKLKLLKSYERADNENGREEEAAEEHGSRHRPPLSGFSILGQRKDQPRG